jgi:hypothetical protein
MFSFFKNFAVSVFNNLKSVPLTTIQTTQTNFILEDYVNCLNKYGYKYSEFGYKSLTIASYGSFIFGMVTNRSEFFILPKLHLATSTSIILYNIYNDYYYSYEKWCELFQRPLFKLRLLMLLHSLYIIYFIKPILKKY